MTDSVSRPEESMRVIDRLPPEIREGERRYAAKIKCGEHAQITDEERRAHRIAHGEYRLATSRGYYESERRSTQTTNRALWRLAKAHPDEFESLLAEERADV